MIQIQGTLPSWKSKYNLTKIDEAEEAASRTLTEKIQQQRAIESDLGIDPRTATGILTGLEDYAAPSTRLAKKNSDHTITYMSNGNMMEYGSMAAKNILNAKR